MGPRGSRANHRCLRVCAVSAARYPAVCDSRLPELGINFAHIRAKSMTVLNPLRRIDEHIMDDADLAGPVIFYFAFATSLLFVRVPAK